VVSVRAYIKARETILDTKGNDIFRLVSGYVGDRLGQVVIDVVFVPLKLAR
jgi:hypothetical protein